MKIKDFLELDNKPRKFEYKNYIWKREECLDIYFNKEELDFETYLASVQIGDLVRSFNEVLNDEIEIIEDKPKKIKKIETRSCCGYTNIIDIDETGEHHFTTNRKDIDIYIPKINELIEQVNYLLEKSDSNE